MLFKHPEFIEHNPLIDRVIFSEKNTQFFSMQCRGQQVLF